MGPDPILLLRGNGWYSSFLCPWILAGPQIKIDPENREIIDQSNVLTNRDVEFLINRDVVGITSDADMIDFTLHISGDVDLIVHTDSDFDPWIIGLPDRTLIGALHFGR